MPKWNVSLTPTTETQARLVENLPSPFGYSLQCSDLHIESPKKKQMIENKLFSIATAPKMQLFMTFMLFYFFIGNSISIYSIFAIVQSLFSSFSSLFKANQTFQPYENMTKSLFKYKAIFFILNLGSLIMVLYKLSKMGLLSFSPSAYIDLIPSYQGVNVIAQI